MGLVGRVPILHTEVIGDYGSHPQVSGLHRRENNEGNQLTPSRHMSQAESNSGARLDLDDAVERVPHDIIELQDFVTVIWDIGELSETGAIVYPTKASK